MERTNKVKEVTAKEFAKAFEVPIADDSINLLYMKESDRSKEIIVKPYGQPFMEVELLFFKKN